MAALCIELIRDRGKYSRWSSTGFRVGVAVAVGARGVVHARNVDRPVHCTRLPTHK